LPLPHSLRRVELSSPSFGLFLLAIAALPFRWLSPLGSLNERAGWTDILFACAVAAWLWEKRHRRWREIRQSLRPWHAGLAAYVILTGVSATLSREHGTAATNLLLTFELAFVAVLAADFGSQRSGRRGIAWAVLVGVLATAVLTVVGLCLYYADVDTGLVTPFASGVASHSYTRVRAGFFSAPLLADYCIFASAILAMDEAPLTRRARRFVQTALGAMTLATLSRGLFGFLAAAVVRAASLRRSRALAIAAVSVALLAMAALAVVPASPDPARPTTWTKQVPDPQSRYALLKSSLGRVRDHPLVGIGPGLLPARRPEQSHRRAVRVHFTPVNIAATVGIPALCALVFVVGWAWRNRYRPTEIAIWSGLLGLAIDGLGQDIEHFRHVWILLGLALARAGQTSEPPAGDA
jgi:hypothetical protein